MTQSFISHLQHYHYGPDGIQGFDIPLPSLASWFSQLFRSTPTLETEIR